MNFVSLAFVVFGLLTILINWGLPGKLRKGWILVMSYLFYASWSIPFITVIWLSTSVDYWISKKLEHHPKSPKRLAWLWTGIIINLLILGYFKYANFFLDSANSLAYIIGLELPLPGIIDVILPLGISFYTFEAISYMVDVYRGKPAARNWLDYNWYIMYFPHLISGPIVRYQELAEQYPALPALPSRERLMQGVSLMTLGFVFKIMIADTAAPLVDTVFASPDKAGSLACLIAALAFTVQIYFDFMGYTHIARGASLLMNIELPLNFNHPYHAANISNFWERWHISLSRWIRDYLYFPLGGSRQGHTRTLINLMLTMGLAGLWHGAGWCYMIWGLYHGALLAGYHGYKALKDKLWASTSWTSGRIYSLASQLITFAVVVLGWIIFRAPNLPTALSVIHQAGNLGKVFNQLTYRWSNHNPADTITLLLLLTACFAGPWVIERLKNTYEPLPFSVKALVISITACLCFIAASHPSVPFIYFQF